MKEVLKASCDDMTFLSAVYILKSDLSNPNIFAYFLSPQTRMQSLHPEPGARYRNVMDALRQIVRTEGIWRPIRGVNVLAVGAGPAHALYFACYEKIKFTLSDAIHPGANSHFANGTNLNIIFHSFHTLYFQLLN